MPKMDQYSCPFCTQQISTQAKKCSHCHEWLKPGKWNPRNPEVKIYYIAAVTLITLFGIRLYGSKVNEILPKQELQKFVKGTSKLEILSKRIIKNGKRFYISGEVRNKTHQTHPSLRITADYFNQAGEKIDTSYDIMDLKAGEVQSYQIEFHHYDKSDQRLYDSYKVEVTSASNYGR